MGKGFDEPYQLVFHLLAPVNPSGFFLEAYEVRKIVKASIISGFNLGGVIGLVVALMLDLVSGNALGGGWYEAVYHDVGLVFGPQWAAKKWVVYSCIIAVVGFIGFLGALMGAALGAIVGKILSKMIE